MNLIQHLIDRQLGTYYPFNCDNFLKRLVVGEWESFYGLQSTLPLVGFEELPPIFASRFSEAPGYEHVLALANEDGTVAIQDTNITNTVGTIDRFQSHDNAVFDLAWMPGNKKIVTVSGDHTACLWDVGESVPRRLQVFSNHSRSVKTIAFRPGEPSVFATGARDGNILLWDVRVGINKQLVVLQPEHSLVDCHCGASHRQPSLGKRARLERRVISITGLVFQDDVGLLSCGESDGNIKLWDLRKSYSANVREPIPRRCLPYCGTSNKNGFTNLIVDESRTHLYASCMDNVIYRYCIAKEDTLPEQRYVGHENSTFYIKTSLSPDGAYLVSGSSDNNAYVWNVRRPEPVVRLVGHWAEVTCVAWCQKGETKIVTSSDDATHKIWRVGPEWPHPTPEWRQRKGCAEAMPRVDRQWGTPDQQGSDEAQRSPDCGKVFGVKRRLFGGRPPSKRVKTDSAPSERTDLAKKPYSSSPKVVAVKVSPTKVRIVSFATPTSDLPNFVLTGEAPHLKSPLRKRKRDWLTQMGEQIPTKVTPPKPPRTTKKRPAKQLPITLLIRKRSPSKTQ